MFKNAHMTSTLTNKHLFVQLASSILGIWRNMFFQTFKYKKIKFFSFPRYHPDYFKALMTNGKNKYIMGSKTLPKLEKPSFKGSLVSRSLETRGPEHNIFQGVREAREASEAVLLCKHYRQEEPKRPKDFWDADSMHLPLRVLAQKVHPRKYQCPTLNGLFFIAWTNWWAYKMQLLFANYKNNSTAPF